MDDILEILETLNTSEHQEFILTKKKFKKQQSFILSIKKADGVKKRITVQQIF
ncbi:hypothetical protein [Candidatus Uabimicrobium sp. HlEnr_7]|uniref:hypothetical protein n=1 Tax=Candidatus Uabimicrobium helgolandensis TaxID=3095367 RepID=UPI0035564CB3